MPTPKPIPIVIEAVQYTPRREPVLIQYTGHGITTGPFARAQLHHTTQTSLRARSPVRDYWSDEEVEAELLAHLAEHGINAVIAPNEDATESVTGEALAS